MVFDLVKVLIPSVFAFVIGIGITPILTHYLYKYKAWKKKAGKVDFAGNATPLFNELHKDKEVQTPRMGGIVIWGSVLITTFVMWLLSQSSLPGVEQLSFFSREQTWLPLALLFIGALIGLIDDLLEIRSSSDGFSKGLSLKLRLLIVAILATGAGWWFYNKLDVITIGLPLLEPLQLGILIVPLFVIVCAFLYASGVIDGIDGLAGGVFATIFASFAVIAFSQNQLDIAALASTITGATLAFLWFNIPPARFYMSETGSMSLTLTLATIAFMTDSLGEGHSVIALPIIAFPLVITVASNIIQVLSKKIRGKKVFLIAPLHHHFEALGWPSYKVTMRYWVLSIITALLGVSIALLH